MADNKLNPNNENFVWFGIAAFTDEVIRKAATLKAYNEHFGRTENVFLTLSHDSIFVQLLLDISKLFDKASFWGNNNCSFLKLREYCISNSNYFPDAENDCLIIAIDNLQNEYEELFSKHMRNKKLAHIDLEELFSFNEVYIRFDDVVTFVEKVKHLVSIIGQRIGMPEVKYPPMETYKECYLSAMKEINKA